MKYQSSDIKPIEQAYRMLREKLSTVKTVCNVPEAEAEDLIHDGFLRLADKDIPTVVEARGKLWATVRNLSIDNFRRRRKLLPLASVNQDDVEYYDYHRLDYDMISRQLDETLTPVQLKIMKMLVAEDMDYSEIAEKMDMTEGSVRTCVSRARKTLKEKMKL